MARRSPGRPRRVTLRGGPRFADGLKTSAITFEAAAGTTYYLPVDSYNNYSQTTRGSIVLGWSLAPSSGREKPPSIRKTSLESGDAALVAAR